MIYLSGHKAAAMRDPRIGLMLTPNHWATPAHGVLWAADNGCFRHPERFQLAQYIGWLHELGAEYGPPLFATAPDVVGDAAATLRRSLPTLAYIREAAPVALVAQDGLEQLEVPWDEFDVLFIGGKTRWKLSEAAYGLAAEAKARGLWVHQGRVNSERRLRAMMAAGIDSADGTYLAFGPDKNLPRLQGWLDRMDDQPALSCCR